MAQSQFSPTIPKLQVAWDATSLGALMQCPRYYQYTILEGWRAEGNEHLEFGGYFASTVEQFKKDLVAGVPKAQATLNALRYAIESTWTDSGPWSGHYADTWRCCGSTPYRNSKGNRAKCPYARAGYFEEGRGPETCGVCGGPTKSERRWVSDYSYKDRYNLVRLVAAYCDNAAGSKDEGYFPYAFADGRPAVELSFQIPLPYKTPDGEPYVLAGHMDSLMEFGGDVYIDDNKTTTKYPNAKYMATYSPNYQVDVYDLAGNVLWPSLNLQGVLIEAAQVLKGGEVRLALGPQIRTDGQREELLKELAYWLGEAERFAREGYWPMNRRNCWSCPFNTICAKDPSKREMYLKAGFVKRFWNPLEER